MRCVCPIGDSNEREKPFVVDVFSGVKKLVECSCYAAFTNTDIQKKRRLI